MPFFNNIFKKNKTSNNSEGSSRTQLATVKQKNYIIKQRYGQDLFAYIVHKLGLGLFRIFLCNPADA